VFRQSGDKRLQVTSCTFLSQCRGITMENYEIQINHNYLNFLIFGLVQFFLRKDIHIYIYFKSLSLRIIRPFGSAVRGGSTTCPWLPVMLRFHSKKSLFSVQYSSIGFYNGSTTFSLRYGLNIYIQNYINFLVFRGLIA